MLILQKPLLKAIANQQMNDKSHMNTTNMPMYAPIFSTFHEYFQFNYYVCPAKTVTCKFIN